MAEKKGGLQSLLDSRLGWNRIFGHPIPKHANSLAYLLGGMAVVTAVILGVTGVILMQFYDPHPFPPGAYENIQFIMSRAALAFTRNVHYWAAQILVLVAILHLLRVYVAGAYKKPREIQWMAGVVLLTLAFAFAFTGTVLKWDQEAIEGLEHNVEIAEGLGALGYWFLPQFAENVPLLTRLYAAHVTVIPAVALLAVGIHVILIRILGISSPKLRGRNGRPPEGPEDTVPFSTHLKRMIGYGAVLTLIILLIALAFPAPLGMRAVEGIEVTKPPWFLLPFFGLENVLGVGVIPYFAGVLTLGLLAVPLVDRSEVTDPRRRKWMIAAMFVVLAILLGLMLYAAIRPPEVHLD